jgi:hypothetical protein
MVSVRYGLWVAAAGALAMIAGGLLTRPGESAAPAVASPLAPPAGIAFAPPAAAGGPEAPSASVAPPGWAPPGP